MLSGVIDLYRAYFKNQFAVRVQYRVGMLLWALQVAATPVIYLAVWAGVAYAQGGEIGGYDARAFAGYYITLTFVRQMCAAVGPYLYQYRIQRGVLSGMLMLPTHPIHRDIAENLSFKASTVAMLLPVCAVLLLVFQGQLAPSWWSALLFFPALILAAALRFAIAYAICMAAFWTTRLDAFSAMYVTASTLLGGVAAPTDLLPAWMESLAVVLPFRYVFALPVELAIGRVSLPDALSGIGLQIGWLIVFTLLAWWGWRAGVRQYTAVDG